MDNFAELLELLKTLLGIKTVDSTRDKELTAYLRGAIVSCETYLDDIIDRRAVTQAWTDVHSPVLLRYSFASDLTSVIFDGEDVTSEWSLLSSDSVSQLYRADHTFFCAMGKEFKASYTAGYSSCPYDLMLAIAYTAAAIESQSGDGISAPGLSLKRETVTGIGTIEYETNGVVGETMPVGLIPAQAVQILDMYRRLGV